METSRDYWIVVKEGDKGCHVPLPTIYSTEEEASAAAVCAGDEYWVVSLNRKALSRLANG